MFYEQEFLFSLLLTLTVEIPVTVLLINFFYKQKKIRLFKIVFAGFMASTLTLPYFWFVLPFYIYNQSIYIFLGESIVVLTEAYIYSQLLQLKFSRSFVISLISNISSIVLGLLF